ncbi:MAG: astroprincin family protein [Chitinophagaceae bacterium]
MKKFSFLCSVIIIMAILDSCKKNPDMPGGPDNPVIPGVPTEGVKVSTSIFGRIVDEADKPLAGVTVTGGGSSTTTDENGIYYITNIMLDQARAYIEATKPGYFHGSRIFQPMKNGLSKPPLIKMMQQKSIGTISATTGGTVESRGGTRIEIPANAIKDYTGTINVVANYINPTIADFAARIPGDMAANNASNKRGTLVSMGMSHLDLLDNNGNKLTIKTGSQVTVSLPVPKSLQPKASATIPMWYFDETKGIWTEEGTGNYQNGKYVGKVSHFSVWNYDHFFDFMNLPFMLQWMLSKINPDQSTMDQILNNPPTFQLTVKDKATKNTLYSNTFPTPTPVPNANPPRSETSVTFPLPNIADVMEVTVTPIQPGGPDYPTNTNYSANADDVVPPAPQFATEQESVTQEVRPTNPPTTITITIPPSGGGGGGNGETVVNVNGKAVNCNNQPVTRGYVVMIMKSGNTVIRATTAPVFGNEGRFTAQYVFYNALPNRVDNVVLTVYDLQTAKKTKDIALQLNPSVAYMIQDPVKVCEDNTPPSSDGKVFNGNYSINNAATLKAFIDSAYNTVNGILYISNIADLSGITVLKKVGGLELRNTTITQLGGLAQLESIGWLSVVASSQLVNLAFPKLANKTMQGIHINHNLGLAAVTLPGIESVSPLGNDYITITGNPVLKTLSIPQLKSVDKCGFIEITNTLLTNLGTFANATGTIGSWGLTLVDNPALTTMADMKNIVISGRLTIDQNPKLTNLTGFNIPANVTDWVTITRNEKLTDISAITSKLVSTSGLTVSINAALTAINFPLFEKGALSIKDNASLASISLPKLKEADGVVIEHNIKVSSINLNALEKSAGGIYLSGGYEAMQALTTFDLPALKSSGRFLIEWCPNIVNLDGFNSLESVNGDLTISNNGSNGSAVKMISINGFNKLASLPYSLNLETAAGNTYTGPLTQIKGFKTLKTLGSMLNIGGLNLTDISGFSMLESIGQDFRIIKTKLTNVNGFSKLKSIGLSESRIIYVQDNPALTDFKGFASLTSVSGIYIVRNDALTSIDGFNGVTSMTGGITLIQNKVITNLNGLTNLTGNTNGININGNELLKNLCGLTKIANGGGTISNYTVINNGYNPTLQNLRTGNCTN